MVGVSPLFQANQLTQMVRDTVLIPNNLGGNFHTDMLTGIIISITEIQYLLNVNFILKS